VAGRLAKWHEDVVLLKQKLVTDDGVTVGAAAKQAGVKITGFVRLQVGEGVEKGESDFAAEVAAAVKDAS
jgi:elongation factor Ts